MSIEVGAIIEGKVTGITKFGAFILLPEGKTGMVHISEISSSYVKDINEHLKKDQTVSVKILSIDPSGKIALSIKQAQPASAAPAPRPARQDRNFPAFFEKPKAAPVTFEDKLARFMAASDEKMSDIKRNYEYKRGSGRRGSDKT